MPFKYTAKQNFPDYKSLKHGCMVGRHLTVEMYEKLFDKRTPNGVTVDKCIQPSVDNSGSIIGLVAGDPESYEVFKELFDAVINEKHGGFGPSDKHPAPDLNAEALVGGTFNKYVKSCRIRTGRSVKGFCLPPSICRAERREVERIVVEALNGLSADLAGKYYPLKSMTKEEESQLIADHFLFQKPTGHLMVNSGAVRDWPDARGIWHNLEKTFLIWINEEDQVRVISMQSGGDLKATFARFGRGLKEIEGLMKKHSQEWAWSERLGFICTCPSNLGTGMRCSVHMQLHKLSKHPKFVDIIEGLHLQERGTGGEHTAAIDDVYDISNRARLKKSEREFVQLVIDGVNKLTAMEEKLEKGESINDLLPANCK